MRSVGTDRERDAVKFTAGFYLMANVITEMSTFPPFSITQERLKIQVNSTQNCDSAKISQTKFLKLLFKEHCDWPGLGGRRIPEKSTTASHVTKVSDNFRLSLGEKYFQRIAKFLVKVVVCCSCQRTEFWHDESRNNDIKWRH